MLSYVGNIDLIVEKRSKEVSTLLEMLRSASGDDEGVSKGQGALHNKWKVFCSSW